MASPDKTPLLDEAREYLRQVPQDQHGPLNHGDAILAAAVARVRELTEAQEPLRQVVEAAQAVTECLWFQVRSEGAAKWLLDALAVLNSEEPR